MICSRSFSATEIGIFSAAAISTTEVQPFSAGLSSSGGLEAPTGYEFLRYKDSVAVSMAHMSAPNLEIQLDQDASVFIVDGFVYRHISSMNNKFLPGGTSEESIEEEARNWYLSFRFLCKKDRIKSALDMLFFQVEKGFSLGDVSKIDHVLRQIRSKDLTVEMLVSVLRATSRAKKDLPVWAALMRDAKLRVSKEGYPQRLLRGL